MHAAGSTGKTIILGAFLGIGVLFLGFMGLVGHNIWQLKYGDATSLRQSITPRGQLTQVAGLGGNARDILDEPVESYIRPHNPTLGSADAPVKILAFIDFECPFCQRAYPTFERVIDEFGPAVQVVFKHFPIQQIHPRSNQAALASACAQEQDKFWPFYRQVFEGKRLDLRSLESYARASGIRMSSFERCLSSEKYQQNIDDDIQDMIAVGARGTPTYFVNQQKVEGVVDFETWRAVIVAALQQT